MSDLSLQLETRQSQAEEAFQRIYSAVRVYAHLPNRYDRDLETVACEMGLSDFYKHIQRKEI